MKRLLLIALSLSLLSSLALAQDSDWTIGSRTLPGQADRPSHGLNDLRLKVDLSLGHEQLGQ